MEKTLAQAAVDATVHTYGTITMVVNNAAATDISRPAGGDTRVETIAAEDFDTVLHSGVHGVLWAAGRSRARRADSRASIGG